MKIQYTPFYTWFYTKFYLEKWFHYCFQASALWYEHIHKEENTEYKLCQCGLNTRKQFPPVKHPVAGLERQGL